jgi:polyhydroxybutyrate depolymerase
MAPTGGLVPGQLTVGPVVRTYRLAPGPPGGPLLLALHGGGSGGEGMAALTGLGLRGPAAGFTVAFPDGWGHVWNDLRDGAPRLARRRGVDDAAFLAALTTHCAAALGTDPGRTFACGISNGALMAEALGRRGALGLAGLGLVAGPGTALAGQATPAPVRPATVVFFSGTADPLVPYDGGPIGALGRLLGRRGEEGGRGRAVGVEAAASAWAAAAGAAGPPQESVVPGAGLPVSVRSWTGPGGHWVERYRIEGGGHTWPGGPQYAPARLVGPVAPGLDATGILLDRFTRAP